MSDFVHLHVHTEYSPLDAPVALARLVRRAKDLGYTALSISDHGTVAGWVKFQQACEREGIKPILGVEAYFTPDRFVKERNNTHFLMLAKNNQGIKNIFRLTEAAWSEGFYYDPRIDWDLLEKHHEGIIATSACVSGIVPRTFVKEGYDQAMRLAGRFREIFGEDYYLEVQHHNLAIEKESYEGIVKISKRTGIPLVGTNDVHYIHKEDASIQETMMALSMGRCLKDPKKLSHGTNQFYLKDPEEMARMFGGFDRQAAVSTVEIAEKCEARLVLGAKPNLPKLKIPDGFSDELEYLEYLARQGLRSLGKEGKKEYEERFAEEIGVIRNLKSKGYGFDQYFLIVAEVVEWAWENGIRVGAGRGSGAGSLLLYCLRITGVDPIPLGLLFERFLHEDRNEMPDIDLDFDHERGEEVNQHVAELYGEDRCARIGTITTYHAAGAIKAAYRVFDPGDHFEDEMKAREQVEARKEQDKHKNSRRAPKGDRQKASNKTAEMANAATKMIPRGPNGAPSDKYTLVKEKAEAKSGEMKWLYSDVPEFQAYRTQYPEMFRFAEHIEGLVDRRSQHAAGVLITGGPTVELSPKQAVKGALSTAFDMKDIELLGGIKFDFLRTKVLTVISKVVNEVVQNGEWRWDFDIDHIPFDNKEVIDMFTRGDTLAIFQFESDGMRKLLRDMKVDCFEHIIAANALFRPGPMENIPSYVARKDGSEKIRYPSPATEEFLSPTYGIMVYQEQVMQIARTLAGFTGPEADTVRKAMGKKKKEVLDKMKDKFLKGCDKTGLVDQRVAASLWEQMESFASYAFNKSHSAGYSFTAYQAAFLKHYFPAEFMAAQISVEGGDSKYDVVLQYEKGIKGMGISLRPLDINLSKADYTVEKGKTKVVRRGFKGAKGIGSSAYNDIVAAQPYKDLMDYCLRAGGGVQSNVAQVLIDEGAFDVFKKELSGRLGREATREDLEADYEDKSKRAQREKREKGARKEEKEGIANMFDLLSEGEEGALDDKFQL
jgi:DNA polymerase-3 subunit alpha